MSLKIDFHVHTENSVDGKLSLENIAQEAKKRGLDGVFICDHNSYSLQAPVFTGGVWLLPGCEYSAQNEHITAVLCDSEPMVDTSALPDAASVIKAIHNAGGIAIIAHPYSHKQKEKWNGSSFSLKPDAAEVYNARAWMSCSYADKLAKNYIAEQNLAEIGGSDAHTMGEVGNAYTVVDCDDVSDIKAAVLAHKTTAVLVQNTKRICKGYSQLERGKKSKSIVRKLASAGVFVKCVFLDAVGK